MVCPQMRSQSTAIDSSLVSASIEQCYVWARENYPIVSQLKMIDKTTQYNVSNASSGNLPQITLSGQATYQSDVTALPIEIPNMEIPILDKDQYKLFGEVYQPLTNFGKVNTKKIMIENSGEIEKQHVELDLYKLKDRVNQIYFGVLLIDEKIEQYHIIKSDLDSALHKIDAAIKNGTATLADRQLLQVEHLSLDQQIDENEANQESFLKMLSTLTGKNMTPATNLIKPNYNPPKLSNNRPELQLFNLQSRSIDLQRKELHNSLTPTVGLFLQGGYGRPALNFLSNAFEFYYIGGIKFSWNISSFYNYKNRKRSLNVMKEKIQSNQEAFLMNSHLTELQQTAEIDKYISLINTDNQIVAIRQDVLNTAQVQLDNGLITTIDYVQFLNQLNNAKQTLLLHETQLLLAQHNLNITTGN
jgi:outer membrane protein TolC